MATWSDTWHFESVALGGEAIGFETRYIHCINTATGQEVDVPVRDTGSWDREAGGLLVNPGDRIKVVVIGEVLA